MKTIKLQIWLSHLIKAAQFILNANLFKLNEMIDVAIKTSLEQCFK